MTYGNRPQNAYGEEWPDAWLQPKRTSPQRVTLLYCSNRLWLPQAGDEEYGDYGELGAEFLRDHYRTGCGEHISISRIRGSGDPYQG